MSHLCHPYGALITCVCNQQGGIYKCFPTEKETAQMTGDMKQDKTTMASMDGRTEIVLATTFLVLVVLLFIR